MSGPFAAVRRAFDSLLSSDEPSGDRPLALVYRGPASLPGCPEAVAALLESSPAGFHVRYVGPKDHELSEDSLAEADLYAQPGGGTLKRAYKHMKHHRDEIRDFIADGGKYLGFCVGGYLAGATPGFDLLPGDTDQYIETDDATIDDDGNTLVEVVWNGRRRTVFFQDGPHFDIKRRSANVLATYTNGTVAAAVVPFGRGKVGVVGPHPEATRDWFTDAGLPVPRPLALDLGHDLVSAVMAR
ncbi:BPL-N domain-containing protein [Fodinicola acaciae]|uniref:BPL-N domain-containing protein n=1 Tax=Fodinicola acaciae TaxID=2681555 RepID=UPI0013D54923|nr:BPL-N domain-containing protein [Fodinicola acaciae]